MCLPDLLCILSPLSSLLSLSHRSTDHLYSLSSSSPCEEFVWYLCNSASSLYLQAFKCRSSPRTSSLFLVISKNVQEKKEIRFGPQSGGKCKAIYTSFAGHLDFCTILNKSRLNRVLISRCLYTIREHDFLENSVVLFRQVRIMKCLVILYCELRLTYLHLKILRKAHQQNISFIKPFLF